MDPYNSTTPGSAIGGASSSSEYGIGGVSLTAGEISSIAARLSAAIDPSLMKLRTVGGGKQAAYLPADEIFGVANESFGFHRWACDIKELKLMHATREESGQWTIAYMCQMRVTFFDNGRPICFHEDVGYGTAERQPKADAAFELAVKSAVTDARKRCLRLFGPILGQNINSADFQKAAQDSAKTAAQQHQHNRGMHHHQSGPPVLRSIPSSSTIIAAHQSHPPPISSTIAASSSSSSSVSASTSSSSVLPVAHPQPVSLQQQASSNSENSAQQKGGAFQSSAAGAASSSTIIPISTSSTPPAFGQQSTTSMNGGVGGGGGGEVLDDQSKKRRAEENRLAALAKRQKLEQKATENSSANGSAINANAPVSALPQASSTSTQSHAVESVVGGNL
jgi:DNA recombination protein Rad52